MTLTRFALIGQDQPARAVLQLLLEEPAASVVTLVTSSPTARRSAEGSGVPVLDVAGLTPEAVNERLLEVDADWLVSANSLVVVRDDVLTRYPDRALNLHPGLLPEYAGVHTHQWAIREGAAEFGATIHLMTEAVDAGDIVAQTRFPIAPNDTGLSLYGRCMNAATDLMRDVLRRILSGEQLSREPQDLSRRRLFRHRDALDPRVDWTLPAARVVGFIRAGNYEPFESPTYVAEAGQLGDEPLRLLRAAVVEGVGNSESGAVVDLGDHGPVVACGDGNSIAITRARAGRTVLDGAAWRRLVESLPDRRLPGR